MKWIITICLFAAAFELKAGNYSGDRTYLLLQMNKKVHSRLFGIPYAETAVPVNAHIPRYQTPKGAVFCRLEDLLTRKTNVWIKFGVK